MTLDESTPLSEHRREVEHWRDAAALTEKEDRERYRLEQADRDACESVEAEEQKWIGIREVRPDWYDRIHWERDVPDRADAGGMPYFREGS